jgi:hypothetical protein
MFKPRESLGTVGHSDLRAKELKSLGHLSGKTNVSFVMISKSLTKNTENATNV